MKTAKSAVIIGAGIAGLATAIRLKTSGLRVDVYEKNSYPGGKLTSFKEKGYRFDMGPSLFTMPQFIEELFTISKKEIKDYFSYYRKESICNYFYEDGTSFTVPSDVDKFAETVSSVFKVERNSIVSYLNESKKKYDLTSSLFLEKSLHKITTYLSADTAKAILGIRSLHVSKTLHEYNATKFRDERLVQFFDRYATYNGSNPYKTPGIMSMIPHLEQYFGTYFPKGGMQSITTSLYQLALDLGVNFHFESQVQKIITLKNKAIGIETGNKEIFYDYIVSNSDVVSTYRYLLKNHKSPEKILQQERSSSALIFYWGISKDFPNLDLHNIFFSEDYKQEFTSIFDLDTISEDPTIYLNISSKEEPTDAPKGCENWFVMINTPSNSGQNWDLLIKDARENILRKMSRILHVNIEDYIEFESFLDPRMIEERTFSYQGALYGAASNDKFSAFLRHPNFSQKLKNIYFCGGSVHPGGGIPLCLLSGKIVSELISKNNRLD